MRRETTLSDWGTRAAWLTGHRTRSPTSAILCFAVVLAIVGPVAWAGLAGGTVVVQLRASGSATGTAAFGPFTAVNNTAGAGACLSTQGSTLPFGAGSSRSTLQVTEPHGCGNRHLLTFLPSTRFTNGLSVPAGHVLDAVLTIQSLAGTTALVRTLHLYIQEVGAGNPILTGTFATVTNGAVTTASTSVANVSALNTYGIGLNMRLNHQATVSTVNLVLILELYVDDGGKVRAVNLQYVALALTY